jgi:Sec-independent protein translocase protein TatA
MGTLGGQEMIGILVLALVLLGPKYPEIGKAIARFRRARYLPR